MLTFADQLRGLVHAVSEHEAAQQANSDKQHSLGQKRRGMLLGLMRIFGPMTMSQCITATGWSKGNTCWHLRVLVERGEAVMINSGKVRQFGIPVYRGDAEREAA